MHEYAAFYGPAVPERWSEVRGRERPSRIFFELAHGIALDDRRVIDDSGCADIDPQQDPATDFAHVSLVR